ncbi:hypothetical protein [Sandaracinus amylolyticus]|uniref:Lipoprotein n=1 Tax=Sandaracinus amylolyticus TaxID=927083 RepID=A0A0F6YKC5_9BACT|nr:hypothetical protein [Sandaracinus amylolyticus]AKF08710.1 hypothetical protein DB32_005859 [Sandaracinus amylolyticus]
MHARRSLASLVLVVIVSACGSAGRPLPLRRDPFPTADLTLVWHGTGEAHRLEDGVWQRRPEHDYELTVVQRRYGDRWESTKEMHRRHPDYDGSAGPRDQTLHFTVLLPAHDEGGDALPLAIESTLGDGAGRADPRFEAATLRMRANVSSMAPFDTYVIEQRYRYAEGALDETVRLVRAGAEGDQEWVRIDERAQLFASARFDEPPTVRAPR